MLVGLEFDSSSCILAMSLCKASVPLKKPAVGELSGWGVWGLLSKAYGKSGLL